jgi:hypothetical protein
VSYAVESIPGLVFAGTVLVLFIVPSFALIGLMVVALAALVALAGAVLAIPYLLGRSLRRSHAGRRRSTEDSVPITTATAQAASATKRSAPTAPAGSTTARGAQRIRQPHPLEAAKSVVATGLAPPARGPGSGRPADRSRAQSSTPNDEG